MTCTLKSRVQMMFAQKDIILLSKATVIVYKAGTTTGVKSTEYISFTLSEGTYSIDDFNAKVNTDNTTQHNTTQHRQDWEPPQVKDLRLVIPKDYLFMSDNTISYALGIPDSYLEKTTLRASLIFCTRGMS